MTHIFTIETQNEDDLFVFKALADRLGLRTQESYAEENSLTEAEELRILNRVNWEGEETGDQLNAMIQDARHFGTRDVEL